MSGHRLTLPNIITFGRILATPVVAWLVLSEGTGLRFAAFVVFVVAALSDVWDGYLARKHGWVTDVGKLLDPLADKLLLAVTLIPFYFISHRAGEINHVPFWGPLPLWVVLVILGRELLITLFRSYASRRGVVIAAGKSGKYKALVQSLFAGGLLLWYPVQQWALARGFDGPIWAVWSLIHRSWIGVTLALALLLTIYSMLDYLWRYRSVAGFRS
ncbi:MAG: CDP-alcohol phosphatidyltransferase family protein [Gemmatimonadales bacterium]|nr:MAG: CDP-alcohol phosphatidyltransferase family protein [Gemmatimonadales bacterium]